MTKKAFHIFLGLWLAAASLPAAALRCERPCRLSSSARLFCLKACAQAREDGRASIGKVSCARVDLRQAVPAVLAAGSAAPRPAPVLAVPAAGSGVQAPIPPVSSVQLRGPPLAGPSLALLSHPSSHAPPAFS